MPVTTLAERHRQLHVKVGARGLDGLVEDVAREIAEGVRGDGYPKIPLPAMKRAVRKSLSRRITAFDLCGLSSVCWDSQEFDPWSDTR